METEPKWMLATKRGWGLVIMGAGFALPLLAGYMGITYDPGAVNTLAADGVAWVAATGKLVGSVMALYGMFRPTAPMTVLPPKK